MGCVRPVTEFRNVQVGSEVLQRCLYVRGSTCDVGMWKIGLSRISMASEYAWASRHNLMNERWVEVRVDEALSSLRMT